LSNVIVKRIQETRARWAIKPLLRSVFELLSTTLQKLPLDVPDDVGETPDFKRLFNILNSVEPQLKAALQRDDLPST
jgi:hypothetical protein